MCNLRGSETAANCFNRILCDRVAPSLFELRASRAQYHKKARAAVALHACAAPLTTIEPPTPISTLAPPPLSGDKGSRSRRRGPVESIHLPFPTTPSPLSPAGIFGARLGSRAGERTPCTAGTLGCREPVAIAGTLGSLTGEVAGTLGPLSPSDKLRVHSGL